MKKFSTIGISKEKFKNKKFLLIFILIITLLLISIISGYLYLSKRKSNISEVESTSDTVAKADDFMIKGQFEESVENFNKAISSIEDKHEKAEVIIKKAAMCNNSGNPEGYKCMKSSLDEYESLIGIDYKSKTFRGFILLTEGDRESAKKILNSALDDIKKLDSNEQNHKEQKEYIEGLLRGL